MAANPYRRVALELLENPDWIPVITEGDSWFSFPGLAWRMNVIGHLKRTFKARMSMLLLSYNGDKVTDILSGRQKRKLRFALQHRFGFRMLIFSAGGNDVIDAIPDIVGPKRPGMGWRDCIRDEVLEREIGEIRDAYRTLIQMRDRQNPGCHIFTHCYDFPTVNGKAVKVLGKALAGPWLKPVFEERGIRSNADQRNIVRHVLAALHEMQKELPAQTPNPFTVVDTTGTLRPAHWEDEIHPSTRGFGLVARKIGLEIVRHFPGVLSRSALRDFP